MIKENRNTLEKKNKYSMYVKKMIMRKENSNALVKKKRLGTNTFLFLLV